MPTSNRFQLDSNRATALLMAASAGLLAQSATASTFTESTDLSNTIATPDGLPSGTDTVIGTLSSPIPTDLLDAFTIPGLIAGSTMNLSVNWTTSLGGSLDMGVRATDDTPIAGFSGLGPGSDTQPVLIPANGTLKFLVGMENGEGTLNYEITLASLDAVPEPGTTAATAAVALAAALELRRRRKAR